jgi:cobalt-zinc-cadmium efflux system outer membrane protein
MRIPCLLALALAGALMTAGCASVPRDRGAGAVNALLTERGAPPASWTEPATAPLPTDPLSLRQTLRLAFERSPLIREQYAELGVSAADVHEAAKLPDLGLGYARLAAGDVTQVTRSLSLQFSDLLLMRSRSRLAGASYASTRDRVAARLQELEGAVSAAWFETVAARQSAELAVLSARAAAAAAGYARSLHAAGNLPERALAQELAAASSAQIAAARAEVHALEQRAALARLAGLSVREGWQVPARLPALPVQDDLPANLPERAFAARLDLAAARRESDAVAEALRAARAWRWLGDLEVGYESESETGGPRLRGPTLHLSLPLFHWNRGALLRAQSLLDGARARRAQLELDIRNELSLGLDRVSTARRIAEVYRTALVPQREAASARTLEEVNFMLAGAFEAIAARREQFAAYQEFIDAVRDYWLAQLALRQASGGVLPEITATESLELAPAPAPTGHDHGAQR